MIYVAKRKHTKYFLHSRFSFLFFLSRSLVHARPSFLRCCYGKCLPPTTHNTRFRVGVSHVKLVLVNCPLVNLTGNCSVICMYLFCAFAKHYLDIYGADRNLRPKEQICSVARVVFRILCSKNGYGEKYLRHRSVSESFREPFINKTATELNLSTL